MTVYISTDIVLQFMSHQEIIIHYQNVMALIQIYEPLQPRSAQLRK
jgi:hypothetical protein